MSRKKAVLFALNSSYSHTNSAVRLLKKYYESLFSCDGLEIKIIEKTMGDRDLDVINELCSEKADMYGFSVYIWNRTKILSIARTVKMLMPQSYVFMGGPEVSYDGDAFFAENPYADSLVCGEGEKAFVRLCEDILLDRPPEKMYSGEKLTADEFEALGSPYSTELSEGKSFGGRLVYIESVRGCPYSCSYCLSCNDKEIREKSVGATLKELEELRDSGVSTVKFVDRTFNYDVERAKELLKGIIFRNFPFCCHFETCAYLIDDETIEILRSAPENKIRLECGVQSTNPETVKAINRPNKIKETLEAVEKLHALPNITLHLDLIAGLPHENYQSFALAYNRLFNKCDMLQLGFLKLLRGTPMRDNADGYVYLPYEPYTVLKTPDLTREQLNILEDIAYLTDKYLNSGAFSVTLEYFSPADPFAFMSGLRKYIMSAKKEKVLDKKMSGKDAYYYLLGYLSEKYDEKKAASSLRMDFLLNENIMPPPFLSPCGEETVDNAAKDVAESFIKVRMHIKPSERGLVYVGRFAHLENKLVICNRNNKDVYVLDK